MSREVALRQIAALEATLGILQAQVATLRHEITAPAVPTVKVDPLPERCQAFEAHRCALRDAEPKPAGGFGESRTMCPGCGHETVGSA